MQDARFYISQDTGSAYWLEGGALMFAPLSRNHTFDTRDGGAVDRDMMNDEPLYDPHNEPLNFKTFGELYEEVEKALRQD